MTILPSAKLGLGSTIAAGLMLALLVPVSAAAQAVLGLTTSGQPAEFTLTGQNASVPGFRSASWGMTEGEVRAALAKDFGDARASAAVIDPLTGNKVIIAPMTALAPGPGPAAISYVFGASSGRLIHVSLDWTVAAPGAAARAAMLDAGAKVVAGFVGNYWKVGSVMRGVVVRPDLIVLFAGADEAGGGVDVRVGGVPYTMSASTALRSVAPPAGPATLHVGFSAPSAGNAAAIPPGAF